MTAQSTIRISLLMVLVWQIWFLHVQGWAAGKQLRRGKQAKGRKRSKEKKKPKPFEGLTRKPVCGLCETEAEKQEKEAKREPPPRISECKGGDQRSIRAITSVRGKGAGIMTGWTGGISSPMDIRVAAHGDN